MIHYERRSELIIQENYLRVNVIKGVGHLSLWSVLIIIYLTIGFTITMCMHYFLKVISELQIGSKPKNEILRFISHLEDSPIIFLGLILAWLPLLVYFYLSK